MVLTRKHFSLMATILALICSQAEAADQKKDWRTDPAATQLDINYGAKADFDKADARLNKVYQQARAKHKGESTLLQKLQKAQQAWIVFRDAHVEARFPDADKSNYGSAYAMCYWTEMAELTDARSKQLQLWVTGAEEGDMCSGSYGIKQ